MIILKKTLASTLGYWGLRLAVGGTVVLAAMYLFGDPSSASNAERSAVHVAFAVAQSGLLMVAYAVFQSLLNAAPRGKRHSR